LQLVGDQTAYAGAMVALRMDYLTPTSAEEKTADYSFLQRSKDKLIG
jgi:hypothetical protein